MGSSYLPQQRRSRNSLTYSDLIPTNQGEQDFVSGDTFNRTTYRPMNPFKSTMQLQSDPTLAPSATAQLQDYDYLDPSIEQDFFSLPHDAMNMSSSMSPEEDSINIPSTQSSTQSPDILDFADPAIQALFEDPAFNKLSFPPVDLNGSTQNQSTEPYERDWTTTTTTSTKRSRDASRPDNRSSCWTSPLCPKFDKEGTPPNPSTCEGLCAPFLFSNNINLESPEALISPTDIENSVSPDSLAPERLLKRHDRDESEEPLQDLTNDTRIKVKQEPASTVSDDSPPPVAYATSRASRGRGRMPHNQVERKYRESINAQLEGLRRVIPSLQQPPSDTCNGAADRADIEDLPNPALNKPSKAVILSSATSYIKQLERERQKEKSENDKLKERVKLLEKIVRCEDCEVLGWFRGMKLADGKAVRNMASMAKGS
ncbi:hypothetical protein NA57DRAFT_55086 [Rhizodiscina lignyota]|uniref:BHLH domain-containing protein n=1 Tax=Rhizodiscina lignyota TaxID=1504668 RepID=A0A9P4M8G4_9PEZI|nr:hypothetical protein NA57DRAFT_55086 [Rhizodiscina lignyota]